MASALFRVHCLKFGIPCTKTYQYHQNNGSKYAFLCCYHFYQSLLQAFLCLVQCFQFSFLFICSISKTGNMFSKWNFVSFLTLFRLFFLICLIFIFIFRKGKTHTHPKMFLEQHGWERKCIHSMPKPISSTIHALYTEPKHCDAWN